MKFKMQLRHGKAEFSEEYDVPTVTTKQGAYSYAKEMLENFNEVEVRRYGRKTALRELLSVELVGESTAHTWYKRTDGMSQNFRGRIVDLMRCSICGVEGKRFGTSSVIKRDAKFRAKKFEVCQEHEISK